MGSEDRRLEQQIRRSMSKKGIDQIDISFNGGDDVWDMVKEFEDGQKSNDLAFDEKKDYQTHIISSTDISESEYKLVKTFFNSLYNSDLENDKFFVRNVLSYTSITDIIYSSELPDSGALNNSCVIDVLYLGEIELMINISFFLDQRGKKVIMAAFKTKHPTYLTFPKVYRDFIAESVKYSGLRGEHIHIKDTLSSGWDYPDLTKRTFDDIFAPKNTMDDIKLYKDVFDTEGRLMTYLLSGPPGTGKTEANKALSYLLNQEGVTIIRTGITEDLDNKVEMAEMLAPSLIVIEDIDFYLGNRKKGSSSPMLQIFLNILDGFDSKSDNVGLLATTNSMALLDIAAQRPGRFDKVLSMDTLTKDNIKGIILKSLSYEFGKKEKSKAAKVLTDEEIIDKANEYRFTGARIYHAVNMYMTKINSNNTKEKQPTKKGFLNILEGEKDIIEKMEGKGGFQGEDHLTNYMNDENDRDEIGF